MTTPSDAIDERGFSPRYRRLGRRRIYASLGTALALCCAAIAAGALLVILFYVAVQGIGAINWAFLTQLPHPVGVPGGGVGNGILGMLIIIGLATAMAVPLGLLTRCDSGGPAFSLRRSVGRSEHCNRALCVCRFGGPAKTLLRFLSILCLHDADAPAAGSHVGASDSLRAADRAGGRSGAGDVEFPRDNVHRAADGAPGDHYSAAAGDCAGHRRDGAPPLHRLWQPVLGDQSE